MAKSWQDYLQDLHKNGVIDQAAIFGIKGDSCWAVSGQFTATPEEIKAVISGFTTDSPLFGTGFYINGQKYVCVEVTTRSVYGRKGKEGICFAKTNLGLLVAHHPETVQRPQATLAVEKLADQLIALNY